MTGSVELEIAVARSRVRAKRLPVPGNSMNCFGRDFRLDGQRRVPDPPESMTGLIGIVIVLL